MPDQADAEPNAPAGLPFVRLFTDGSCRGNPGPGGWAYILKHPTSGAAKERNGGEAATTNNRMELTAVIEGLAALKTRSRVEVVTDSAYVAKGAHEWLPNWKRNGWKRRDKGRLKPVLNEDLWKRLDALLAEHSVAFSVVRGHSGHPENERCDELAVEAATAFQR